MHGSDSRVTCVTCSSQTAGFSHETVIAETKEDERMQLFDQVTARESEQNTSRPSHYSALLPPACNQASRQAQPRPCSGSAEASRLARYTCSLRFKSRNSSAAYPTVEHRSSACVTFPGVHPLATTMLDAMHSAANHSRKRYKFCSCFDVTSGCTQQLAQSVAWCGVCDTSLVVVHRVIPPAVLVFAPET